MDAELKTLLRRLKAARLDNTVEAEMRKLARVELLILDDFALQTMDQVETADFYELVVERRRQERTPHPLATDVPRPPRRPAAPAADHYAPAQDDHPGRALPPGAETLQLFSDLLALHSAAQLLATEGD